MIISTSAYRFTQRLSLIRPPFYYLFITLIFFLVSACQKDNLQVSKEKYQAILKEMSYQCPDELGDSYFQGYLDDQAFCYDHDQEGMLGYIALTTAFISEGPEINTNQIAQGNTAVHLTIGFISFSNTAPSHYVVINFPTEKVGTSFYDLVKKYIKKEGLLPIRSIGDNNNEHYEINFNILSEKNTTGGHLQYIKSSKFGSQPENAYLRITSLDILPLGPIEEEYSVKFEFTCDLYDSNHDFFEQAYFGHLNNCEMQLIFRLQKTE